MTQLTVTLKKSKLKKAVDLFICLSVLFSSPAFARVDSKPQVGEYIQTNIALRGRTSSNFISSSNIRVRSLSVGTVGKVLKVVRVGNRGNEGVQILLQGEKYKSWSKARRTVWVYNWTNRTNDIKQCADESCESEAPTMAAASHTRTVVNTPSADTAETINDYTENNPWAAPDDETAAEMSSRPGDIAVSSPSVAPRPSAAPSMVDVGADEIQSSGSSRSSYQCGRNAGARTCMVCNCYFESRGEPIKGKIAVGLTVMSRVNSGLYPASACGVIYDQGQFSWTRPNGRSTIRSSSRNSSSLYQCEQAADFALKNSNVRGPMNFHATYVNPRWGSNFRRSETIGNHVFYARRGFPSTWTIPVPRTMTELARATGGAR